MPPPSRSEDAPEDSFLRDPSDLDGFLEDVRSEPGEGGAPDPEGGPAEAPREVSVDVGQVRLDEEASTGALQADDGAEAAPEPRETPGAAAEAPGDDPDPDRFWASGFRPAGGAAGADEAADGPDARGESGGDRLAAKLAELERTRRSEGI